MALPKTCSDCQVFFLIGAGDAGECRLNPPTQRGGALLLGSYPVWSGQTRGCSCGLKTIQKRVAKKKKPVTIVDKE